MFSWSRGLENVASARDADDLGGNVARLFGGEKDVTRRYFDGLPCTPQRCPASETGDILGLLRAAHLQRCPDGAGSDRVDADSLRCELFGQRAGEPHDGAFRCGVVGQERRRLESLDRRSGDDTGAGS